MRSKIPRVSDEQMKAVASALKLRKQQLHITREKISQASGINIWTVSEIFTAQTHPRLTTLDRIMAVLGKEGETQNPFPSSGVDNLLQWAQTHTESLAKNRQEITAQKEERHRRSIRIGAIIKQRMTSMDMSLEDVARHISATTGQYVSRERIRQIEEGRFTLGKSKVASEVARALGYSSIDTVLEENTQEIVPAPEWMEALRHAHEQGVQQNRIRKNHIGAAVEFVCKQKGFSRAESDRRAGYTGITAAVVSAHSYGSEKLTALLRGLGIESGSVDDLLAHYDKTRYTDGGAHLSSLAQTLKLFPPALRTVRGVLGINTEQLSSAMPERFRLLASALQRKENVYDTEMRYKMDSALVGALAGIYNAGKSTNRFAHCEHLQTVAEKANNPETAITYEKEFTTQLEGAMQEVIDIALNIAPDAPQRAKTAQRPLIELMNNRESSHPGR